MVFQIFVNINRLKGHTVKQPYALWVVTMQSGGELTKTKSARKVTAQRLDMSHNTKIYFCFKGGLIALYLLRNDLDYIV